MQLPELQIYENGTDTVIAHSPEDAVHAWEEANGVSYHDACAGGPDDWTLTDGPLLRISDDDGGSETLTLDEWITEEGRGFLCSTEF